MRVMEFHGRSWKFQEKENVYNYHLVANQASRFLASDFFVFLCVFCLSSLFRFTNRLVFWRKVLLSISYSHCYNSQQVWLLAHHHLPLRPSQGEI
jgi:hypothetical protein